jgi:hypothetical protein
MRIILILIVIVAIFALIQTKRHNCEFGGDDWLDCVISNTEQDFSARTGAPLAKTVAWQAAQ